MENRDIKDQRKKQCRCGLCGGTKGLIQYHAGSYGNNLAVCDSCLAIMYSLVTERVIKTGDVPDSPVFRKYALSIAKNGSALEGILRDTHEQSVTDRMGPKEISRQLGEYVIGQDHVKKSLAIALYTHMKRIRAADPSVIGKSNILLAGPTGSGKTLLAKTLSKIAGVPFVSVDATSFTQAGYVGRDVEDILAQLLQNADGDVGVAEKGIVYIDEVDKLRRGGNAARGDVGGEAVQQALLKMVEGTEAVVPVGRNQTTVMRTDNILFICGGAFEGAGKAEPAEAGFTGKGRRDAASIGMNTLLEFGMIPEFLGRFPVVEVLDRLTEEDLVRVLTEPRDSILKQYENLFRQDGIQLLIPNAVLRQIAHIAAIEKTGARGLRSVMERVLRDSMFGLPYGRDVNVCRITQDTLQTGKAEMSYVNEYSKEHRALSA